MLNFFYETFQMEIEGLTEDVEDFDAELQSTYITSMELDVQPYHVMTAQ